MCEVAEYVWDSEGVADVPFIEYRTNDVLDLANSMFAKETASVEAFSIQLHINSSDHSFPASSVVETDKYGHP
ncbi:MAG: hypothetical protein IJQ31_14960 [Thermoguttaceae bacterium]|nr:hypothetical protein [Thermoguttaceae bacterium]